jgi:hypothetical protein
MQLHSGMQLQVATSEKGEIRNYFHHAADWIGGKFICVGNQN